MTRAAFNFRGQKTVKYCAAHKKKGMENLKSKCCEVRRWGAYVGLQLYGYVGPCVVFAVLWCVVAHLCFVVFAVLFY